MIGFATEGQMDRLKKSLKFDPNSPLPLPKYENTQRAASQLDIGISLRGLVTFVFTI